MTNKTLRYFGFIAVMFCSCNGKDKPAAPRANTQPQVLENGSKIVLPASANVAFFETELTSRTNINAELTAPAKVSATIAKSQEGASQNIVLFDNPELAGNYTQLIQHLSNINQIQNVNIRQKKIELERIKDLQEHGVATGKDLMDAQTALSMEQTNLANERAAIIEHETKLKVGGFRPDELRSASTGRVYVICDVPENQISRVKAGVDCKLSFTAFPGQKFIGRVDGIADIVDQTSRMVKVRITVDNSAGTLKVGMFATALFGLSEGENLTVNKNAMITVQAKNFVFVKTGENTFERREVSAGNQVGDRIIINSGLQPNEQVAIKGVMQLKGLSFGY